MKKIAFSMEDVSRTLGTLQTTCQICKWIVLVRLVPSSIRNQCQTQRDHIYVFCFTCQKFKRLFNCSQRSAQGFFRRCQIISSCKSICWSSFSGSNYQRFVQLTLYLMRDLLTFISIFSECVYYIPCLDLFGALLCSRRFPEISFEGPSWLLISSMFHVTGSNKILTITNLCFARTVSVASPAVSAAEMDGCQRWRFLGGARECLLTGSPWSPKRQRFEDV